METGIFPQTVFSLNAQLTCPLDLIFFGAKTERFQSEENVPGKV